MLELIQPIEPIYLKQVPEKYFQSQKEKGKVLSLYTKKNYIVSVKSFIRICTNKIVNDYSKEDFEKYCNWYDGSIRNHSLWTLSSYSHRLHIIFNYLLNQHLIKENIITDLSLPQFRNW